MQASTRAFIKRGGAVCAAAAVLLGGTFTAGAATASPSQDIEPTSISSAVASATATPSATEAPLPDGLAEAVEQDLGLSEEEFNERGALASKAVEIKSELTEADADAVVSLDGDTINVKTTESAAAKTAAGDTEVNVESVIPAAPTAKTEAPSEDVLLSDYIAAFGDASSLQAIMRNAAGDFVIRTGEPATGGPATGASAMARSAAPAANQSLNDFVAKYGNVSIETASGPATPYVDVVNGQGYIADGRFACSIGWNGFNAAGKAAVISAGHCTGDGELKSTVLSDPETEPAVGGTGGGNLGVLGDFGFSQFGGPGNSPVTGDVNDPSSELGNIGTDISVIDGIDPAVNQVAKVTDWSTPADPQAKGPKVSGVSEAIVGAPICKSGRTTGWSCGTVAEVGIFLVRGDNGTADLRAVRGFGSANLEAAEGDSGGSIITGSLAVGMISAGTPGGPTFGVSLTDALSKTAGYSVKIFLNAPSFTTPAPVYREGAITGTVVGAPAGSTIVVTVDGVTTEVAVGADGKWTAKAPNTFGTFKVTAVTKNGFSTSTSATGSVEVIKETLKAPAITTPVNDGTVAAPVTTIAGTGTPKATVKVTIADDDAATDNVTGNAVVNAAGDWSFELKPALAVGNYKVTARQTLTDWNDSATTTSAFAAVPAAPAIVSPANGAEFAFNEGPTEISGTNIAQASVVVTVNGKSYNAVVTGTTWSVALDARLSSGNYSVTAVQNVEGTQSLTGTSAFFVLAEPAPAPTTPAPAPTTPAPAPTTPAPAPTTPAPAPAPDQTPQAPAPAPGDNDMDLANTGASSTMMLLGAAGGLLLLGGAAFLLIRRRSSN